MKRKRFSVEQIVAVVKQAELGLPVAASSARSASRTNFLSLEEGIRRSGTGPGARIQATGR